MSHKFFWIPAMYPEAQEAELNRFVASHRVLGIEQKFVERGGASAWVLAVEFADGAPAAAGGGTGSARPKVDYQAVLEPADFAVYSAVRIKRKELAERESVPAYAIITNEQMAKLAQLRATTLEELSQVEGLGETRIAKYGQQLLGAARSALPATATREAEGARPTEDVNGAGVPGTNPPQGKEPG